jgi:hypothetical protein
MADRLDPPELLGIDVQELARPFALIAHDRRPRLERAQLAEPQATQDAADGRGWHRQLARDRRTGVSVTFSPERRAAILQHSVCRMWRCLIDAVASMQHPVRGFGCTRDSGLISPQLRDHVFVNR